MTIDVDNLDINTPTAIFEEHETRSVPVEIPDLYDTHEVYVEAELNLAGVMVEPEGISRKPLERGQSLTFDWSVLAERSGNYRGTVQLSMVYVSKENGEAIMRALPPQAIEIEVVNLFGLGGSAARLLGGIGVFISTLFGAGDIIEVFFKIIGQFLRKGDYQP